MSVTLYPVRSKRGIALHDRGRSEPMPTGILSPREIEVAVMCGGNRQEIEAKNAAYKAALFSDPEFLAMIEEMRSP